MSYRLKQLTEEIEEKRDALAEQFRHNQDEHGDYTFDENEVDDVQQKFRELEELEEKKAQLAKLTQISQDVASRGDGHDGKGREIAPNGHDGDDEEQKQQWKSVGELFIESAAFKSYNGGTGPEVLVKEYDFKTEMTTSAGFAPETRRTGRVEFDPQRPPRVIDIYPVRTTNQTAIVYMEETTFTNNAAEVAESANYPEAALAYTERTSTVRKIGIHLPVTKEQLDDVDGMRGVIDNRLELMLRQRLDSQLIAGNGTAPNIEGLTNTTGIQTQAAGTDPIFDTVYKAINLGRSVGFSEPNWVLMHPDDFEAVRLERTADGIYIYGHPADSGPARLWGLPVVTSTALTENTGYVVDSSFLEVAFKQGIEFQMTDSHASEFIEDVMRIKASIRLAHVVYRPEAVVEMTGI